MPVMASPDDPCDCLRLHVLNWRIPRAGPAEEVHNGDGKSSDKHGNGDGIYWLFKSGRRETVTAKKAP
jgi:hypothetical protein